MEVMWRLATEVNSTLTTVSLLKTKEKLAYAM